MTEITSSIARFSFTSTCAAIYYRINNNGRGGIRLRKS